MLENNDIIKLQKIIENAKKKDANQVFSPSLKILLRIIRTMFESGSIGKTLLSQQAKISYDRLAMYVELLEKKHLVESVLEDHKIKLRLTENGRRVAVLLCDLDVML